MTETSDAEQIVSLVEAMDNNLHEAEQKVKDFKPYDPTNPDHANQKHLRRQTKKLAYNAAFCAMALFERTQSALASKHISNGCLEHLTYISQHVEDVIKKSALVLNTADDLQACGTSR